MGVDDLLLGLTHHWCRDRSVFPTEEDRLDLSTIMLFQSYTACRPAELVDGTKSRGKCDPMQDESDDEDLGTAVSSKHAGIAKPPVEAHEILPHKQDEPESSQDGENLGSTQSMFDESDICGSDDTSDGEYYDTEHNGEDSYDSSSKDIKMVDGSSISPSLGIGGVEEDNEPVRKHKALCYEDIVLWIVQDPNYGGRDVLAMEVFFRYHKGADKKPKPYVKPSHVYSTNLLMFL